MKLEKFIEITGKNFKQAANELNFSYEDIRRYCKGTTIPRPENMKKLIDWSNGAVQPNDFYEGCIHEVDAG